MRFDKDDLDKRVKDGQSDLPSLRESLSLTILMHQILVPDGVLKNIHTLPKNLGTIYKNAKKRIDDGLNPYIDTEVHLGLKGHTLDIYLTDDKKKIPSLRKAQYPSDYEKIKYSISISFAGESNGRECGGIDFFSEGDVSDNDVSEGIRLVKKVFSYLASEMRLKNADSRLVVGYRKNRPSLDPLMQLMKSYGDIKVCVVDIDTKKMTHY